MSTAIYLKLLLILQVKSIAKRYNKYHLGLTKTKYDSPDIPESYNDLYRGPIEEFICYVLCRRHLIEYFCVL